VLLKGYSTVSVTLVVTDALPEAAVTVIWYVPAGVPVAGLSAGLEMAVDPPHAANEIAAIKSKKAKNCGA
jgi:hypothetical protein